MDQMENVDSVKSVNTNTENTNLEISENSQNLSADNANVVNSHMQSAQNIVSEASANTQNAINENTPLSQEAIHTTEYHNWFMLHTYSGFEMRVEKQINELKRTLQDKGLIHQVLLPTEKIVELGKDGQKRTSTRKLFPGYIMVQMTMTDFSWHLVQSIPKVTGFVGGKNRPAPMGVEDVKRILSLVQEGQNNPGPKVKYDIGDEVRVVDGPFAGFNGNVEDVNQDKGKLRVSVSIFGRQTPVELDFVQVSKG